MEELIKCPKCGARMQIITLNSDPPRYAALCSRGDFRVRCYERTNSHAPVTQTEVNNKFRSFTMELKTKYPWTVVSSTHIFNKYGDFRKYGDDFFFSGSYLTHSWVKYWDGEYLIGNDLHKLLNLVEKKISCYRRNQFFFRAFVMLLWLSAIAGITCTLYIWFLKLASELK